MYHMKRLEFLAIVLYSLKSAHNDAAYAYIPVENYSKVQSKIDIIGVRSNVYNIYTLFIFCICKYY